MALRLLLAVVFFALGGGAIRAADEWPVKRGPSQEPSPYRFDAKVIATLPKPFLDDADAVILYAGTTNLVEADGTIETISHEVTRLNGRKGIERHGEFRGITFAPSHQKLILHEARIHKPDGTIVKVEPRHVHLRDVATDYQVYDPEKQLIISFPGLAVGDVIEVKWSVRGRNPEHDGQFFTRYSMGDLTTPVVVDEFRVRLPKNKMLHHAVVNGKLTPIITTNGDTRLFNWRMNNIPRGPRDDNPPSREELRVAVAVSTFADWAAVGEWKQRLRRNCWTCTPAIRQLVARLTAGLTSPQDRARVLAHYVRRHIRYVSAGERHDYTPHLPQDVLANRFGDCKDTSQLLAVMLREAGIQVELATLGVLDDGQVMREVPSPWGTHAILLVTIGQQQHWIDTTTRLAGWDVLPRDDCDRLCYVTDDKGKLRLVRTPALTASRNRVTATTDVWIGPDGTSRCKRVMLSHDMAALSARDRYLEVPPGEQRRQMTADLQDANSRTRLLRLTVDQKELADQEKPVRVETEFEIPRHFSGTPEMEGSVTDSRVWGRFLAYTIDHDRTSPLVLPSPFESTHTYRFHLSATHALTVVPRDQKVHSRWGTFEIKVKTPDEENAVRRLDVTFHMRLDQPRVELDDLEDFRKFQEGVAREYRLWLTMKPVRALSAAPMLEELLAISPQNTTAAVTLAKLYIRGEKFADAWRVLQRACYYSPDEAALWELRVEAARTPAEELEAHRELVKRYPQEPRYALDLGGILVSLERNEEARQTLEPLTKAGSDYNRARAHYQLGRLHARSKEYKQTLEELERAEKLDKDAVNSVRARVMQAEALDELKRPADALEAYKLAHELDRTNQPVLLSLVRLCLATKNEAAAEDYLRRFVTRAGKDVAALSLAAETYLKLSRLDEAFQLASRAREIRFHERTQRVLGLIYLTRGEPDKALVHLDKANPDATVLAALLEASLASGKLGEVETLIDKAGKVDTSDRLKQAINRSREVLARRAVLAKQVTIPKDRVLEGAAVLDGVACAEAAWQAGRPVARVETLLQPAFQKEWNIGLAFALRARSHLDRGKLRLAVADAEKAIALSPQEWLGYLVRGRVRLERAADGAMADLQTAAKLTQEKNADVLLALAETQLAAGRRDDARKTAQTGLKLRPQDAELQALLKTVGP